MLLARLVVHEHALLHGFYGDGAVDVSGAFAGQLRGDFEGVVGAAAVAAGVAGDELQRIVVGCDLLCAQASFAVFESFAEQGCDARFAQRFEDIDAATREQRGDDLKRWIFRRSANESDDAALHVG